MKSKVWLFSLLMLSCFVVGCSKELKKQELEGYYKDLVNTYADGLIPVYDDTTTDKEITTVYKRTLKELVTLNKKYSGRKSTGKQTEEFTSIKKLNKGMIKEFKGLVKAESDTGQASKDGMLIQEIANKYENGKTTNKFEKFKNLANNDSSRLVVSSTVNSMTTDSSSSETSSVFSPLTQEKGVIYGILDKQNPRFSDKIDKVSDSYYKDGYVSYGVSGNTINVVKEDFRDLPLDRELDKESIKEHIHDFMVSDATKIKDIDSNTFIYQSPSQNLEYKVKFTLNSDRKISFITILRSDR